ncbi:MAG: hypothetical protein HYS27_13390 [Deltaproteobacteria bacterium]|nr:hypothetical protein [Deltaproteobacteria bacterium]
MSLSCPECGATYRAGFTRCNGCQVDLVDEATAAAAAAKKVDPRVALEGVPKIALVHAGLPACREIERALLADGVPCLVEAEAEEGEPLAAGAVKVGVIIAQADLQRAGELLRRRFEQLIAKEGVGSFNTEAIDLAAAEVQCPACGHTGALSEGACADCGLFLGAPE